MSYCPVEASFDDWDRSQQELQDHDDWVAAGPTERGICDTCGLFYRAYLRDMERICEKCLFPERYKVVGNRGKRVLLTETERLERARAHYQRNMEIIYAARGVE